MPGIKSIKCVWVLRLTLFRNKGAALLCDICLLEQLTMLWIDQAMLRGPDFAFAVVRK